MNRQTIGTYQILGELGHGGMGVVYHGRDPAIGRPVAIKVIRVDAGATLEQGAELRQRLIQEASSAGQLSHPGIVTIYQLGEEGSDVFVVMEFIKGDSLHQLLSDKVPLDQSRGLEMLRQIAEALDYAHRAGIVHRDVKPANILVREDGCIKVADFGLAKMIQDHTRSLTAAGVSLGSPAYMSPEQVRAEQIDGRSDQFSLAIVAFQMLTGRLPFAGDSAHAVMFQIVSADPLALQDACGHLPPGVTAALGKALAKNANDRYPTCAAFVRELAEHSHASTAASEAATVKVAALAPAPAAQSAPVSQSKPPWLLIAILLLVLLLAGGGYWLSRSKRGGASGSGAAAGDSTPAQPDPPLIKAIDEGRMDDARNLIAKGADVNAANQNGVTALMQAAIGSAYLPDNVPAVKMLLEKKANVDAQDKRGLTALHHAVAEGKTDAANLLLDAKANPNMKDAAGMTPLLAAVEYGRSAIMKTLLERGADIEIADATGTTPLMRAAEGSAYAPNNAPFVQALLDKGAKLETQDAQGRTALNRAAAEGKVDGVRLLLDKKANINTRMNNGSTALLNAVAYGRQPVVQLLLERGADVDQANSSADTPLMIAAEGASLPNNVPVLTMLIGAKAKIDLLDARGRNALHRASTEGKEDAVRLLLEKKADINLKAADGSTPLMQAVTNNKLGAATVLMDHGADVNLADAGGNTPLMAVAEGSYYPKGQGDMIALLLKHGAKTEIKNNNGQTALDRATESKKTEAIQLLQKK
ncbi:MAG TPA: ankyrin repeat domain-containing protein [Bryobacteraceae bacterium]